MNYEQTLEQIMQHDDRVMVITAENRAPIRNLPNRVGNKFLDVGICEQTMVGAAAGLALRGRRPFIHALSTFLTLRAYEFTRTDVGIARLPVTLVAYIPGLLSDGNGPTHQALEDINIFRSIPNMQIFCPMDNDELLSAIPKILETDNPTYIRYYAGEKAFDHQPMEIGKAEVVGNGTDIALISYGFMVNHVLKAKEILEKDGYSVTVVNARWLNPFDTETILTIAKQVKLMVSIEDHFKVGGLYTILSETYLTYMYENNLHRNSVEMVKGNARYTYNEDFTLAKVFPIALDNRWFKPGTLERVMKHEGFTAPQLAERVKIEFEKINLGGVQHG